MYYQACSILHKFVTAAQNCCQQLPQVVLSPGNFVRRYCLCTVLRSSETEKSVNQMSTKTSPLLYAEYLCERLAHLLACLHMANLAHRSQSSAILCNENNVLPNVLDPPQIRSSHAQSPGTNALGDYLLLTLCTAIHFVQLWDLLKQKKVPIRMSTKSPLLHAEFLCEFVAAIAMKILRSGFRKAASVGLRTKGDTYMVCVPYVGTCHH
jgi:hypothetical protein